MVTCDTILAWRITKARGVFLGYTQWSCKEVGTTEHILYIFLGKIEVENFLNLLKVIHCLTNITPYGRTLSVFYFFFFFLFSSPFNVYKSSLPISIQLCISIVFFLCFPINKFVSFSLIYSPIGTLL